MAKILFVNPVIREEDDPRHVPYGLALLAAIAIREGHLVQVYDANAWRAADAVVAQVLKADHWDVIALGGITTAYRSIKKIVGMARTLAPEATIVTYGAMSLQPMCIPNGMLIFKNLRFTGFWVNKWYDGATPTQRAETFAPLFKMAQRGLLRAKVEKTYSLPEAKSAIAHASQAERNGKIVFEL